MSLSQDLRGWIEEVEGRGELLRLEGADWDLEIGCLVELNRSKEPPALLFDQIKGYPSGYRILTSSHKTRSRIAHTLNIPSGATDMDFLRTLALSIPVWEKRAPDFEPEKVPSAPFLENIHKGEDLDLLEFPAPKWHERDGGRYIGTADVIVTRDPDSGEVNLGTYRVMVHDKKTLGLFVVPGHHGETHYKKWHERNKACPVALSFGHHPLTWGVACLPLSMPEYQFAGAIRGKPVAVVEEEITGLPVPADSEILVVGWCPPGKTRIEGPFGEWTGYYASKDRPAPVIEVERIYHRDNPILLGACPSRPPSDSTYYSMIFRGAMLYNHLLRSGISDLRGVWLHEGAGGHPFIVVSIKQRYVGHAKQAALTASQSPSIVNLGRYVIVVDEDIDPSNIDQVLWALSFRTDPEKDIDIVRRAWSSPLDPMIRKPSNAYYNSRAIIDACKPYEWIDEFPAEVKAGPELIENVKKKWAGIMRY